WICVTTAGVLDGVGLSVGSDDGQKIDVIGIGRTFYHHISRHERCSRLIRATLPRALFDTDDEFACHRGLEIGDVTVRIIWNTLSIVCNRIHTPAEPLVGEIHGAQPVIEPLIRPRFKFCCTGWGIGVLSCWQSSLSSLIFAIWRCGGYLQHAVSMPADIAVQNLREVRYGEHPVWIIFTTTPGIRQ